MTRTKRTQESLTAGFHRSVQDQIRQAVKAMKAKMDAATWKRHGAEVIAAVTAEVLDAVAHRLWEYKPVFGGEGWTSPAEELAANRSPHDYVRTEATET